MATFSNRKAFFGLTATGAYTEAGQAKLTGQQIVIGEPYEAINLSTASPIVFAAKITSAAASNVATLDLTDGTLTGSPTFVGGDGNDFEGVTLGTIADIEALSIVVTNVNSGTVAVAATDTNLPDFTASVNGHKTLVVISGGKTLTSGVISFTFSAGSQEVFIVAHGLPAA